jgi:gentisate 1,2-dioxygenase
MPHADGIQFIIEGTGAYTAVDGERVYMAPGVYIDAKLVARPATAGERVVWMDGLDIPLTQSVEAMFFQFYTAPQVPATRPPNASRQLHGHAHVSPTWVKEKPRSSPLLLYSWEETSKALDALRNHEGSKFDGIALEYRHPQTGGPVLPTMACWVQLLRPGSEQRRITVTPAAPFIMSCEGKARRLLTGSGSTGRKEILSPCRLGAARTREQLCDGSAVLFSSRTRPSLKRWDSITKRR